MFKNKFWIFLSLALIVMGLWGGIIIKKNITQANGTPAIYLKVEASADNGATWHNYSDTDNPGGEALSVNPGDTIQVRIKIWNAEAESYSVTGAGSVTNADYIADVNLISLDADGNTNEYTGYFFGDSGTGGIIVSGSGDESSAEIATASITLSNDFPAGETVIEGGVDITTAEPYITQNPFRALAQGLKVSVFRLVVNQAELPTTGADL